MNEIQTIQNKIYEIRGQRVMMDFDLAAMYGVETRALNQSVKRNIERFPEDFMFQLTKGEFEILTNQVMKPQEANSDTSDFSGDSNLSSQIVISRLIDKNDKSWGGLRKPPYAFTEFRRLASTLALPNTAKDIAQLRKDFEDLKLDLEDILHDQNDINESTRMQLENITLALSELQAKEPKHKPRRRIGFIQNDD